MVKLCLAVLLLFVLASATLASAEDGFCTGAFDSTYRRASWMSYNAGGITVDVRQCRSKNNDSYVNADILNTQSFAICLETVSNGVSGSQRWLQRLDPGEVVSYSTRSPNQWRFGATPLSRRPHCY